MNKYKLTILSDYGDKILCFEFEKEIGNDGSRLRFVNKDNKIIEVIKGNESLIVIEEI